MFEFKPFGKIARLNRAVVATEKLDGTNAQIVWAYIDASDELISAKEDPNCLGIFNGAMTGDSPLALYAGSRNRWITPSSDNYGFAGWVLDHAEELRGLGPGIHFGEWWGQGIQRNYGLTEKRFSLFQSGRWVNRNADPITWPIEKEEMEFAPACCHVVPIIARGIGIDLVSREALDELRQHGSMAAPGFMRPEGIVIYHTSMRTYSKVTLEKDEEHKGQPC